MTANPEMMKMAKLVKQIIELSEAIWDLNLLQEQVAFHFTTGDLQNVFKAMPNAERARYLETFYANFPGWDLGMTQV
jgi:hypothetical protein